MTIKELIKELENYKPEYEVEFYGLNGLTKLYKRDINVKGNKIVIG